MKPSIPDDTFDVESISDGSSNKAPSLSATSQGNISHSVGSGGSGDAGTSIAKDESAAVFRLRMLVFLVLFLAATAVSVFVYYLTSANERDEFVSQFEGASTKVLASFEEIIEKKLSAIGSLAVQASLYVNTQRNVTWPFVTVEDWELRSGITRDLSGALFTRIAPVVELTDRVAWEKYSVENTWWIEEANMHLADKNIEGLNRNRRILQGGEGEEQQESYGFSSELGGVDFSSGIGDKIYEFDATFTPAAAGGEGPWFPLWQEAPTFGRDITNFDTMAYPPYAPYMKKAYETGQMAIGGLDTAPPGDITHPDLSTSYFSYLQTINAGKVVEYKGDPMSSVFLPVFDDFEAKDRQVKAIVFAVFKWAYYFEDLLPSNFPGVVVVLENNCQGAFTYKVVGENVEYLGQGDLHKSKFDDMERSVDFTSLNNIGEDSALGIKFNQDICEYQLRVYPSEELEDEYITELPIYVTIAVACVFVATTVVFLIFNRYVEARQTLVYNQAVKSTAIVSSLFPEAVRDRLMDGNYASGKNRLKSFLNDSLDSDGGHKPIADMFPYCTVFFADIAGFTAWSSTRDPTHVFVLLETIYQSFDALAKQRGVFKVETIGDSYVAVTGLPNPNERHALVMARFATACMESFHSMTRSLEGSLGPDTSELGLRIGLHSGPVTAGVLRGDRSRFQLFGDTVNTAARMESSGQSNMIQISSATANLLKEAGKEKWIKEREDTVNVKGKGVLASYWLDLSSSPMFYGSSSDSAEAANTQNLDSKWTKKETRLVSWITELLLKHIQDIVARQDPAKVGRCGPSELIYRLPEGSTSLDEVAEIIKLPKFDAEAAARARSRGEVVISPTVVSQLREIVGTLAAMYRDVPFHNFEHACHVTMAVDKFMNRIVTPDIDDEMNESGQGLESQVHDYTHGINNDPLTLLAIVFSALIHDADHRGISNMQLAKEDETMAALYHNKSIAEQNSLDVAWELLMSPEYNELRSTIFIDRSEMLRFRQVTVNVVLATDIFDKELNGLRKNRWDKAFKGDGDGSEMQNDLRATIVIEHIIQASDVSHTMQHWHIYRKWNERLFMEMLLAFKQGRMAKSPLDFWYKGEIGFFDNYVIPLAKKLKECNVFGVSSDECLNYATRNRMEWEERGEDVIAEIIQKVEEMNLMEHENDGLRVKD